MLGVSRADDVVRLRYKALPELRAPLRELVAGENECCNVGGVRFGLEGSDQEFVLTVSAPDAARARLEHRAERDFPGAAVHGGHDRQ